MKPGQAAKNESGEQSFTFPHGPQPVVIIAKNIAEATEKFEEITKAEKSSGKITSNLIKE